MADRISRAFAEDGDKNSVPTDSAGTSMSFQDGWTSYYELEVGVDAGALDIDRGQHNQIWNMITANIKEWQEQTWPEYQSDIAYPKWSIVQYSDGNNYIVTDATTAGTLPTNTSYFESLDNFLGFGTAAYVDLITSDSDTASGAVMRNGSHGIGEVSSSLFVSDFDTLDIAPIGNGSILYFTSSTTNQYGGNSYFGAVQVLKRTASQGHITVRNSAGQLLERYTSGSTWTDWKLVLTDDQVGTAAYVDTGTGSSQVPLNSDLGSVAYFERSTSTAINDGTNNTSVPTPLGLSNSKYNPDNRSYESTAQTLSLGGIISVSHGLGEEPKWVQLVLECTTAEYGYTVGDRIFVYALSNYAISAGRNTSLEVDSSSITLNLDNTRPVWAILNKSTLSGVAVSYANWDLYIKAGI